MLEKYPYQIAVYEKKTYGRRLTHFALHVYLSKCSRMMHAWNKDKPSLVLAVSHQPPAGGLLSGPSLLQCDGLCLSPAILFVPASPPVRPHSAWHTRGLDLSQEVQHCTVAFWFTWASSGKGPEPLWGRGLMKGWQTLPANPTGIRSPVKVEENCWEHNYYGAKPLPFWDPPITAAFSAVSAGD